jgi:hypothetical protein
MAIHVFISPDAFNSNVTGSSPLLNNLKDLKKEVPFRLSEILIVAGATPNP